MKPVTQCASGSYRESSRLDSKRQATVPDPGAQHLQEIREHSTSNGATASQVRTQRRGFIRGRDVDTFAARSMLSPALASVSMSIIAGSSTLHLLIVIVTIFTILLV